MATTKPQIYTHVLEGLNGSHALLCRLNWSSLTDVSVFLLFYTTVLILSRPFMTLVLQRRSL